MAWTSRLVPGEIIIDDSNAHIYAPPVDPVVAGEVKSRGYTGRPRSARAEDYGATDFPRELIIPRSEWTDRVKEMEESGSLLSQLADQAGLTVLDQNGTNYCWVNAPTHCLELLRVRQGEPMVRLSPASAGAVITGYRNRGGMGLDAVQFLVETGVCPQSLWPPNAIEKKYDTPESRKAREAFKVVEWWDLPQGDFDALFSVLLMGLPCCLGLDWWGHEITVVDPVVIAPGKYGVKIDNSWSESWGTKGRGILAEVKARGDQQCPRAGSPTIGIAA
jgi:hypothetical protein